MTTIKTARSFKFSSGLSLQMLSVSSIHFTFSGSTFTSVSYK